MIHASMYNNHKEKKSQNISCIFWNIITIVNVSINSDNLSTYHNCLKILLYVWQTVQILKLAGRKSALNPPAVYSTDCSKAVVPVLVLLFVALWFILWGDLFYVFQSF